MKKSQWRPSGKCQTCQREQATSEVRTIRETLMLCHVCVARWWDAWYRRRAA